MKDALSPDNIILSLTLEFAIDAVTFCDRLSDMKKFVLANQLLRSATSVGACAREAQNAESKSDFIHKFKMAAKEAEESHYWLQICRLTPGYPDPTLLTEKLIRIIKILNKIIGTTKKLQNGNLASDKSSS